MRIALALGALSLFISPTVAARAAPATAEASATKTFSAWTATCDNLRDCVVIGSGDDGDALFYVRIARGAGASSPQVKLVLAASDPIPGSPGAVQLSVGTAGAMADRFAVEVKKDDPDGAALAGAVTDPAFLVAMEKADTLDYLAGTLKGRLALKGLASALRFVDERQGRSGTPTALVAPGTAPLGQIPPPPVPPMVQVAAIVAAPVASPMLSRALLDMAKPACDPETVEAHSDAAAWMLGPDRRLVAVPCTEGAYNVSVALFTTDAKGDKPLPAMLEEPPKQGDAEADNVVVNYDFDVKTLALTSLDKTRGLGDCGASRTWVWTGEIFALLRATELEACPGALPEDWPPVFEARRP